MTDRREYQRQWAARRRRAQGMAERTLADHGTAAAYRRHQYHGEEPCAACRDAWAAYQRERYQRRKGTA